MTLEQQIAWVKAYREKKSQSTYLIPSTQVDVEKEEFTIKTSFGDIRALVYTPKNLVEEKTLPAFVNMHGGGYVKGSPDHDDIWCPTIAQRAQCRVFNISYPLAPENKFPIAIHAVYDFIHGLYEYHEKWNINPNKIAIGGHSAGGNLATAVCLYNLENGNKIPLVYQILDYPAVDIDTDVNLKTRVNDDLPPETVRMYNICYLNDEQEAKNPLVSPLYATSLEGMPPALIMTAEYDILLKETKEYADRLKNSNVKVTYREFKGVGHGFNFTGNDLAIAEESWYLMSDKLKEVFYNLDL